MKPPCETCGRIHATGESVAIGRFTPTGPTGYRAKDDASAPVRASREAAEADACRTNTQATQEAS